MDEYIDGPVSAGLRPFMYSDWIDGCCIQAKEMASFEMGCFRCGLHSITYKTLLASILSMYRRGDILS